MNPAAGNWTASAIVPTQATRFVDFNGTFLTVWDFIGGNTFPGNIIPLARIPPHYSAAFQALPLPNSGPLDGPVAPVNSTGLIPADGALTLNFAAGTWIPISTSPGARAPGF